jgi:hypothetical protein
MILWNTGGRVMKSVEIEQTAKQEMTTTAEPNEMALKILSAMGEWSIRHLFPGRHILYLDGKRYGTWDSERNEFVD